MRRKPTDEQYKKYEAFIKSRVKSYLCKYGKRNGLEYKDFLAIANEAFLQAWKNFDPSKNVKFITFLSRHVEGKLHTAYFNPKQIFHALSVELEEESLESLSVSPERVIIFKDSVEKLSSDAKRMVYLVLCDNNGNKLNSLLAIENYLRKNNGWTLYKVRKTVFEVRLMLREMCD